jgi:hypothetical protein
MPPPNIPDPKTIFRNFQKALQMVIPLKMQAHDIYVLIAIKK